ncbi:MAG: FAD synthetase family protein, partial [Simkania negevensis]|nr:FAD synthetase family protein [Simkania negevensis]
EKGMSALLTFSNHPLSILAPHKNVCLLSSIDQKIALIKEQEIDLLLLLPFTKSLSETPYDLFLRDLHSHFPFSYLVLGEEAAFGKNREGNQERLQKIANELLFTVEYLPTATLEGLPISSGRIRKALEQGDFSTVEKLLGRPYSLLFPDVPRLLDTHLCSYQTELFGLCPLPDSYYVAEIAVQGKKIKTLLLYQKNPTSISLTFYVKEKLPPTSPFSVTFLQPLALSPTTLINKETLIKYL